METRPAHSDSRLRWWLFVVVVFTAVVLRRFDVIVSRFDIDWKLAVRHILCRADDSLYLDAAVQERLWYTVEVNKSATISVGQSFSVVENRRIMSGAEPTSTKLRSRSSSRSYELGTTWIRQITPDI